jgi:hypothetical protein
MPAPYAEPGYLASRAKSNLATFGNGATESQIAAKAIVKTIQRDSGAAPIVLTGSFQVIALGVETIAGGQKIILTGSVTGQVTAATAGTLSVELTVDNVLVGAVFAQSFEADATNVSVSFCFEVTPTPGTRAFALQAKHDDLSSVTIPAHGGVLVEQIVTV